MSVGEQYREKNGTVEAFQYVGEFPLSFLRAEETVRSAGAGTVAAIVTTPNGDVQVSRNDFVVREYRSGRICSLSAQRFRSTYEPIVTAQAAVRCDECGGAT